MTLNTRDSLLRRYWAMNREFRAAPSQKNSKLVVERTSGMLRVGHHASLSQIDDQIQFFKRNLADQIGQFVGDFDDAKNSNAPRQLQFDRRTHAPLFDSVRHGPRSHSVDGPESQF